MSLFHRRLLVVIVILVLISHIGYRTLQAQTNDSARIAAAVLPLPEQMRSGATVVSQADDGTIVVLRNGSNGQVCRNDSTKETFIAYCVHQSFFSLLKRAGELSKQLSSPDTGKVVADAMDKEIKAGKLTLPTQPIMMFMLEGPISGYSPATNTVNAELKRFQMVHVPYTTGKALALPEQPSVGMAWVMASGTWLAHIMIEH